MRLRGGSRISRTLRAKYFVLTTPTLIGLKVHDVLRFVKPSFINPALLEEQNIPLEKLLEDEAAGMAFPLDAKYFDDFPLIYGEPVLGPADREGQQYPKPESQDFLQNLCHTTYGYGGWYHKCPMPFQAHTKMRLFGVRGYMQQFAVAASLLGESAYENAQCP